MKTALFLILFILTSKTICSQNNIEDSVFIRDFNTFVYNVGSFINTKYPENRTFISQQVVVAFNLVRDNSWTEFEPRVISSLKDQIVLAKDLEDSIIWETVPFNNYLTESVLDQTTDPKMIMSPKYTQVFVKCDYEEWALFYFNLIAGNKKNFLTFQIIVNDSKSGFTTNNYQIFYNEDKGFFKLKKMKG